MVRGRSQLFVEAEEEGGMDEDFRIPETEVKIRRFHNKHIVFRGALIFPGWLGPFSCLRCPNTGQPRSHHNQGFPLPKRQDATLPFGTPYSVSCCTAILVVPLAQPADRELHEMIGYPLGETCHSDAGHRLKSNRESVVSLDSLGTVIGMV